MRYQPLYGIAALLSFLALATGCAHEPAFRAALPANVDVDGKAIAIVGDFQQTGGFVRFVRRREDTATQQRILVADMQRHIGDMGALVIVGDLVYSAGSTRQWDHLDDIVAPFAERMPVLAAVGNHDYPCFLIAFCRKSVVSRGLRDRFPWLSAGVPYAVPAGDLLLLFLDSEGSLETQAQWLEDRLGDAAGNYAAALVFFHRPAFSNTIDQRAEGDPESQRYVVPVLTAASLPVVVFSGHIHGYEDIVRDGVRYITTAGGGGPRGPLANERPFDVYRGPDCVREKDGALLRPFNYLLLRRTQGGLHVDVRGFCRADPEVRLLDTIDIPLAD
jgi:hypothetical protein